MEDRKLSGSSSSFTSDLFGSIHSSSSGIFGSIFSPSSKILGQKSFHSESPRSEGVSTEKKQDSESQYPHSKAGVPENSHHPSDDGSLSAPSKDMDSYYQEEKVQPCHLSSSIYYGGPDVYSYPKDTQTPAYTSRYRKDGGEDDSDSASRGNWWQGSLYY